MLDMARAMRVTENCIRFTAKLFPPSKFPIDPEDVLVRLGIDNSRIDVLKSEIIGNPQFGLRSLIPPRTIDRAFLAFDEEASVSDVFTAVRRNAVLAGGNV